MLLDRLTANAAASHGDPPPHGDADAAADTLPANNASFLAQLPLSLLGSYLRRPSPSPSPSTDRPRAASAIYADDTRDRDAAGTTTTPPDHKGRAHNVHMAASAPSRPASSGSSAAADDRQRKHAPRPRTTFLFAKPVQPPTARPKLHLRPKLLLQLHQVVAAQRPKPAYEIIPFSLLPPKSIRRLARSFNTRDRLGPHHVLIVEAEPYTANDHEKRSDNERWESRDVIAVLTRARSDKSAVAKAEICMNDGMSRWEASAMPNGSFEFNTTDDHGLALKARWVLKPPHLRKSSSVSSGTPLSPTFAPTLEDKKFTFSTISSSSRRHPIIATMTRHRIDIMDSYVVPPAASPPAPGLSSPAPTAPTHAHADRATPMAQSWGDGVLMSTDDALRHFIIASGIWVAANIYAPIESAGQFPSPATATPRSATSRTACRSVLDSPRSASPASTLDDSRHSIHRIFRSGTGSIRRSQSIEPPSSPASTKTTTNTSPVMKTRGRRSTSDANIRSMTGSMRKRYGLALEDQTLPESEEERQGKRSVELLRIRELALPTPIERPSMETASVEMKPQEVLSTAPLPSGIAPDTNGPASPASPMSPSLLAPALLSSDRPDPERARKSQSAYNPIQTAGLWDSGVVSEGARVRSRPTSMLVSHERKRKQDKKRRSKSENNQKQGNTMHIEDDEFPRPRKTGDGCRHKLKLHFKNWFRRETAAT